MAKNNWAQNFSNDESVVFEKGDWTLTEDGEHVYSLYFKGKCVEPVVDLNNYTVLNTGFLMFSTNRPEKTYVLYSQTERYPIFKLEGSDISLKQEKGLLIFTKNGNEFTYFQKDNLMQVSLNDENQIGFAF